MESRPFEFSVGAPLRALALGFLLLLAANASAASPLAPAALAEAPRLSPELTSLQQSFFELSLTSYASAVQKRFPEMRFVRPFPTQPLALDPGASRMDWLTTAQNEFAGQEGLSLVQAKTLAAAAESLFLSYHQNQAFPHFAFLSPRAHPKVPVTQPKIKRVTPLDLPLTYPSPHTLDVQAYVRERFAWPLQNFIHEHQVAFYGHNTDCDQASAFHVQQGFTEVTTYMGVPDNSESPYVLAENPQTHAFRFIVCELNGRDDVTRIKAILGPVFQKNQAYFVEHENPAPLIQPLRPEQTWTKRDLVVIGFQNALWWQLHTSASGQQWTRTPIGTGAVETNLFVNSKTGQRVLSVANMYGDEMTQVLDIVYAWGLRRFVYLGTAGGLDPRLKVGDVVLPETLREASGQIISFRNDASLMPLEAGLGVQIAKQARQGWVGTIIDESKLAMEQMQTEKVQALDIEVRYFAEFFKTHPSNEQAVILVISDAPLSGETYDKANLNRQGPADHMKRLFPQILNADPAANPSTRGSSEN